MQAAIALGRGDRGGPAFQTRRYQVLLQPFYSGGPVQAACPASCPKDCSQPRRPTNQGAQDDQRAQEHQAAALGDTRRLQPGQGLNRRWTRGAARTSPEIGRKEAQASCMYVLSVCPTDSVERVHCSVFSVVCSTLCVFSYYHSRHVSPRRMCSFHKLYLNCTPPQKQHSFRFRVQNIGRS